MRNALRCACVWACAGITMVEGGRGGSGEGEGGEWFGVADRWIMDTRGPRAGDEFVIASMLQELTRRVTVNSDMGGVTLRCLPNVAPISPSLRPIPFRKSWVRRCVNHSTHSGPMKPETRKAAWRWCSKVRQRYTNVSFHRYGPRSPKPIALGACKPGQMAKRKELLHTKRGGVFEAAKPPVARWLI
ncbi:hypothetical protein BaRGS_00001480, partial [Batillaria attramentaria]